MEYRPNPLGVSHKGARYSQGCMTISLCPAVDSASMMTNHDDQWLVNYIYSMLSVVIANDNATGLKRPGKRETGC